MILLSFSFRRVTARCAVLTIVALALASGIFGQAAETGETAQFRIGERITYVLSTERYPNAGFASLSVVSRGRLGSREAIELSGKFRTTGLFSATGFLADETINTFVAPETGMPIYVKRVNFATGLPRENTYSYLEAPAGGFDLLSLIYRLRGGFSGGSSILLENGKSYTVTFLAAGTESVSTAAGTYETTILTVQSDYLTELGVSDLRINIETAGNRLPVLFRAKMQNGEMKATISSVHVNSPEPVSTPTPVETPRPQPTPTAMPTPEVYVDNRPLSEELAFALGERLEYRVTYGAQRAGKIVFEAKERKQFNGTDSLLLTATVTELTPPQTAFIVGDKIAAQVDPQTLFPKQTEIAFRGPLAAFSQIAAFDEQTSRVVFGGGTNRVDVPVGTHSVLSLLYAMRSFKLNPTSDATNPVNDTRVSVFWSNKANIFVLRPMTVEITTIDGRKVAAVVANITTNDPVLDQLAPKVWLSQDARRVPLKFTLGQYQFDLESSSVVPPK